MYNCSVTVISSDKLQSAQSFLERTREDLQDAGKSFFRVCFRLYEAKEYNYPVALGYSDIYELAENEFGFKRSTTASYIAICNKFMHGKMFVVEPWSDYSFSQLVEMLPIRYINRRELPPTCTIKQIREWKQAQNTSKKSDSSSVQTSGQNKVSAEVAPIEFEKGIEVVSNVAVQTVGKLNLKNVKARGEWLDSYRNWGVWLSVPELELTCYKYKFVNGDELVVSESYYWTDPHYYHKNKHLQVRYHLNNKERTFFDLSGIARTYILDYLTKNAAVL